MTHAQLCLILWLSDLAIASKVIAEQQQTIGLKDQAIDLQRQIIAEQRRAIAMLNETIDGQREIITLHEQLAEMKNG
jgi:hypothetical protein